MAADLQTCTLIRDFLSTKHNSSSTPGRPLLESRLRTYLFWKRGLMSTDEGSSKKQASSSHTNTGDGASGGGDMSEAMKKKDADRAAAYAKRRRVRGGAPSASSSSRATSVAPSMELDPDDLADL